MSDPDLVALYGREAGCAASHRLDGLLSGWRGRIAPKRTRELCERDAVLITYPDMLREVGVPPLTCLSGFCGRHLADIVTCIHVLPPYPSSSDGGFSVIDYRGIDPMWGSWEDLERLGDRFSLMLDAVVNHVSAESRWFQAFLHDDPAYQNFFLTVPEGVDLSAVVRPRSLPLLSRFTTPSGEKRLWTTFSADQIDLNYGEPAVLLQMIDTLLFYASHGASLIRLDAVGFLWKRPGTSCLHLPETHGVVRLFRRALERSAPHVLLVTETNVPHEDNVSYFGNGVDEAHLVYNFALPPLTLHAFHAGNATTLSRWALGLSTPSHRTAFLNFLASHDGIGLNPARGILGEDGIRMLVDRALTHGGLVSYRDGPDGSPVPYELNINYFDALSNPGVDEDTHLRVDRFLTAHAILMALSGVPTLYFHSLFGSVGWRLGVEAGGGNRAINREHCDLEVLERELADAASRRSLVFTGMKRLLAARAAHPAFHPQGGQSVLHPDDGVFALLRTSPDRSERILCVHNVSGLRKSLSWNPREIFGFVPTAMTDVISGSGPMPANAPLPLGPYQSLWLKPTGE